MRKTHELTFPSDLSIVAKAFPSDEMGLNWPPSLEFAEKSAKSGRLRVPMGRPPHETTEITPFYAKSGRLQPPDGLGEAQRRVFVDLIASCPASQFRKSDVHLLARWSELTIMAEQAALKLEQEGMVVAGQHGFRASPWFQIHRDCCRELRDLSQRLLIGPRGRQPRAAKVKPGVVSYYERAALGDPGYDDAAS
jgi:hypothetical protein